MIILSKSDGEKMCDSCIRKEADIEVQFGKEYRTGAGYIFHATTISLCKQCADDLCRLLTDSGNDSLGKG